MLYSNCNNFCFNYTGRYTITKTHLKQLVLYHSKDKHCLTMSDIDIKDKMKFGPTLRMMKKPTIEYLKDNIADSNATALFLDLMRMMYRSYVDEDVMPLERIQDLWYFLHPVKFYKFAYFFHFV